MHDHQDDTIYLRFSHRCGTYITRNGRVKALFRATLLYGFQWCAHILLRFWPGITRSKTRAPATGVIEAKRGRSSSPYALKTYHADGGPYVPADGRVIAEYYLHS
jgi:hypothetical protein